MTASMPTLSRLNQSRGVAPERSRGDGFLVVVRLDIGDAAVVVHGDVQVRVPASLALGPLGFGRPAAVGPPPAAGGHLGDLLHVDMHQLAGMGLLIAAHPLPGGPVDPREPVQAVAHEPSATATVDAGTPSPARQPRRAEPPRAPQPTDLLLHPLRRLRRRGVRPARAVLQARRALSRIAADPLVHRLARAAHLSRPRRLGLASLHPLDHHQPRMRRQPRPRAHPAEPPFHYCRSLSLRSQSGITTRPHTATEAQPITRTDLSTRSVDITPSNGRIEGTNNLLQVLRRRAHGFTNHANFEARGILVT